MKKTWMRLNINYYTVDRPGRALETSIPVKTLKEGLEMYTNAITLERCSDNDAIPPRATLNKYIWNSETNKTKITTIVSNDIAVGALLFNQ